MKKTTSFMLAIFLVAFNFAVHLVFSPALKKTLVPVALADDDEEEDDEDEEDSGSSSSSKVEYKTIYTRLPDQIITTTKQVPRYDSDGDGKYDDEDPHPEINEFLIVNDSNQNGIDDRYE